MTAKERHDITGMLAAWNDGSAEALDRVIDIIYPELRRAARKHLARRKPGESLESAALANEVYLKLLQSGGIRCENRTHFPHRSARSVVGKIGISYKCPETTKLRIPPKVA